MRIRCLVCGDVIQYEVEGMFVKCTCGSVFVNAIRGGGGKTRIGGRAGSFEPVREGMNLPNNPVN